MELFNQNDKKWGKEIIGKSGYSLASSGCVITSLCNCANLHGADWTPDDLNRSLYNHNGLTDTGLVVWDVAEKILGCHIDPNYYLVSNGKVVANGQLTFGGVAQYIGRYTNKGVGHFVNIIGEFGDYFVIYDCYYGKAIVKLRSEINRVVKVWW